MKEGGGEGVQPAPHVGANKHSSGPSTIWFRVVVTGANYTTDERPTRRNGTANLVLPVYLVCVPASHGYRRERGQQIGPTLRQTRPMLLFHYPEFPARSLRPKPPAFHQISPLTSRQNTSLFSRHLPVDVASDILYVVYASMYALGIFFVDELMAHFRPHPPSSEPPHEPTAEKINCARKKTS